MGCRRGSARADTARLQGQRCFGPFSSTAGWCWRSPQSSCCCPICWGAPPRAGREIPYESGITPTGSARLRYGLHFYTVGIFFILFDVEAIFLYAWAVAFRELSWAGYIEAALFILVLFLGLVYIWRLGGLDWSPSRRRTSSGGGSREERGER